MKLEDTLLPCLVMNRATWAEPLGLHWIWAKSRRQTRVLKNWIANTEISFLCAFAVREINNNGAQCLRVGHLERFKGLKLEVKLRNMSSHTFPFRRQGPIFSLSLSLALSWLLRQKSLRERSRQLKLAHITAKNSHVKFLTPPPLPPFHALFF